MKAKQMVTWSTLLGLTLSSALCADSGMSGDGKSEGMMFEQGYPIDDDQVMSDMQNGKFMVSSGINHPGRINPSGSYDFFVTGSFIYWMASSDGFNINKFPFRFDVVPSGTFAGQPSNVPNGVVDTTLQAISSRRNGDSISMCSISP